MNKLIYLLSLAFIAISCSSKVATTNSQAFDYNTNQFKRGEYTLIFNCNTNDFSKETKGEMVETFFIVYPKLVKDFNKNAVKTVYFIIDKNYTGVAEASDGKIRYNPNWFVKHPKDIDVVTHEAMHIVQNYGNTNGPWWITEGIADYVRQVYGVANEAGGWSLPEYKSTHKYTDGYRITARFLLWIETNIKSGFVQALDKKMRDHQYSENVWKELTDKTVDELWKEYSINPKI